MKQGTVICIGNFELPDKNAAAHRVVNNGKLLRELGYRTIYLGTCRGERWFDGVVRRDYDSGFDMYEQSYPFTSKQWAEQIFDIGNIRELVRRYPDTVAVILYNTQYATLAAVRRAFSPKGICVLYDCTEWNGFTEGALPKRLVKSLDSRLIENLLPGQCDGIITVSTVMRTRYGDKKPLLLLPPLVDTQDPVWRQVPQKQDRFTFCYAGAPSDKERLNLLLEAFARLPAGAAALRIIGMTCEEYAAQHPETAALAQAEGVSFTGRLPHDETVREILSCGCFIFLREPGRRNNAGFPTKFAEAFTCGVPMITTDVSDVSLYADDSCVLLPDVSPDGILQAMTAALSRQPRPRALRDAFDYRNHLDVCHRWLERIPCRKS